MPEPNPQARPAFQSRIGSTKELLAFVGLVLVVRWVHIVQIPSLLTGMNPSIAVSAKALIESGISEMNPGIPPLSPVLLALPSFALDRVPGALMSWFIMAVNGFYAIVFWFWLCSLPAIRPVRMVASAAFLFLPMHNGYDGLDSVQTLLAGAIFLAVATLFNNYIIRPKAQKLVAAAFFASLLPLTRNEYGLLLPWYVFLVTAGSFAFLRMVPLGRYLIFFAVAIGGLALGGLAEMAFQYHSRQKVALIVSDHLCWTFLDGVPASWLSPEDNSEYDRRMVGIRKFGHPSQYDYSLVDLMRANPGATFEKFYLNIPRWLTEIGGRLQILPFPAAILAVLGFVMLVRRPPRKRRTMIAIQTASLILTTVPLIVIMLYAEYLRPVYPAACLLMGYGVLAVSVAVCRVVSRLSTKGSLWAITGILVVGMECCYFWSGANYPDMPNYDPMGTALDQMAAHREIEEVLLDPYVGAVDVSSRVRVLNPALAREYLHQIGESRTQPIVEISPSDLFETVGRAKINAVFLWGMETKGQTELQNALDRWQRRGFHLVESQRISGPNYDWSVALCVRETAEEKTEGPD